MSLKSDRTKKKSLIPQSTEVKNKRGHNNIGKIKKHKYRVKQKCLLNLAHTQKHTFIRIS